MKLLFLLCICFTLYAPYDPNPVNGNKKRNHFFIRYDPKTDSFIRIRIHDCVIEKNILFQPERLSEKTPQKVKR